MYKIIEEFTVKTKRVLTLDREFDDWGAREGMAVIDGKKHFFSPNSIKTWIVIDDTGESFKGKTVTFS